MGLQPLAKIGVLDHELKLLQEFRMRELDLDVLGKQAVEEGMDLLEEFWIVVVGIFRFR